jgi:hypothetical protein
VRSFHDYWLTGHSVDGEGGVLTLRLSEDPRGVAKPDKVDVVFTGVMDYFLEHDLGVSIVFAIDERSLGSFIADNLNQFTEHAKWGWPKFWKGDSATSHAFVAENQCRVWELQTSYGLSGWIVAAQVDERGSVV